jgi:predicted N-formylglutamate amidohydrolase
MSRGGPDVERVCFLLRVRQDRLDEYRRWQTAMAEYLVPPMRRIEEVFHLE